ncbi:MAG: cytochrome C [Desulfuromonas sp.]|nr:MAG: cytochrome C [Desulfuromonas sp.]
MIRAICAILILWATPLFAAEFDHAAHLRIVPAAQCSACHLVDADDILPLTTVCLDCHDQDYVDDVEFSGLKTHGAVWSLQHAREARKQGNDCASCHEQDFCLECHAAGTADEQGSFGNAMTNVHRSDFMVSHPIAARTDQQLCSSCHEVNSCTECHDSFAPADLAIKSHRRGWSDISISGSAHEGFSEDSCQSCHVNSVLPTHDWSYEHSREARRSLASCQACHPEGDICLTCHSSKSGLGINPHPKGWGDIAENLNNASNGRTCRRCH